MFYVVPGFIMAVALTMAFVAVRHTLRLRRAWRSGLTAEARCLRMFTTARDGGDSHVRTTLHHVYEFTARDGRQVRFEEQNGPATIVEGDIVPVYYTDGRAVFANVRRPNSARNVAGLAATLAFLGLVVGFCVGFMVTYNDMAGM
ncbi:DUF3592 domain-containing protein [Streptomyces sp. NPDC093064]|uniref:DUF3592 domain-containing protein n=1 Tax=Streptomyces sp. NPDC093064 TaxID=3366020 RepID=UPI00380CF69E